jgi:hypothetical protein
MVKLSRKMRQDLSYQFACVKAAPMRPVLIGGNLLEGLNALGSAVQI